uniref:Uncharacterized protein n=1 Tax=Arundo donax TaxID=35708 RepID=A0A0A8ZM75_ARUDO
MHPKGLPRRWRP